MTADTPRWFIGAAPEEKGSVGEPVEVGIRECVTFGCFDDVRVVQEGQVGAPDNENKSYGESIDKLINGATVTYPWVVAAAGVVGFIGNELVAVDRIGVGRRIGSAALVADGLHARTDGTSPGS